MFYSQIRKKTPIIIRNYLLTFRFNSLENEVRKRDEIISQLQKRIQELERLGMPGMSPTQQPPVLEEITSNDPTKEVIVTSQPVSKSGSSGSDDISGAEEGFMVCELSNIILYILIISFLCIINQYTKT